MTILFTISHRKAKTQSEENKKKGTENHKTCINSHSQALRHKKQRGKQTPYKIKTELIRNKQCFKIWNAADLCLVLYDLWNGGL